MTGRLHDHDSTVTYRRLGPRAPTGLCYLYAIYSYLTPTTPRHLPNSIRRTLVEYAPTCFSHAATDTLNQNDRRSLWSQVRKKRDIKTTASNTQLSG